MAHRRDFVALGLFALVLRLVFCWAIYPQLAHNFEAGDGYDEIARNLVAGRGYELSGGDAAAERLPLMPLFYAAHFYLFGIRDWPWQLTQSLLGALTCGIVFSLAAALGDRRMALLVAIFCAVHPTLLLYAARPFTETVYTFLLVLLIAQLSRTSIARPTRARLSTALGNPVAVGVAFGLQLLTKNTAALHGLVFLPRLRDWWRGVVVAIAVALLTMAPWAAWNVARSGSPHLRSGRSGITLYHGVYISRHVDWTTPAGDANLYAELELHKELAAHGLTPDAPLVQRDRIAAQAALRWIAEHSGEALRLWARNLLLTWYLGRTQLSMQVYAVLHGSLLVMAMIGTTRLWRRRPATRPLIASILLLAGSYTGFHAALQPAVRYILPVVPLVAVLAAGSMAKPARTTEN